MKHTSCKLYGLTICVSEGEVPSGVLEHRIKMLEDWFERQRKGVYSPIFMDVNGYTLYVKKEHLTTEELIGIQMKLTTQKSTSQWPLWGFAVAVVAGVIVWLLSLLN